jgi:hypothetical protein
MVEPMKLEYTRVLTRRRTPWAKILGVDPSPGRPCEPQVKTLRDRTGEVCGYKLHAGIDLRELGKRRIPECVEVDGPGVATRVVGQLN